MNKENLITQIKKNSTEVYRIYEKPAPKRVFILSFAEHDLAYEKAKDRK